MLEPGGEPRAHECAECGGVSWSMRGFVYRDGDAHALYFATLYGEGHSPRADLAIGIGSWSAEDTTAESSAFLQLWATKDEYQFGFVDPQQSSWFSSTLLGGRLMASRAREHQWRDEFFAIAELVLREDPAVRGHLG